MRPDPQYGVQLSVEELALELPLHPIYGVTPSNKYIPIQVNDDGQLSVGNVTITGPVTINDVVIKGVDPDNGNTSEDIAVYNLGSGNGYSIRSSIFDGANHLVVNNDGSVNTVILSASEAIPVQIEHNLDSVAIYGTDGTNDQFIKTDSSGNLQVGIVGTPSVTIVPSSTGTNLFSSNAIPSGTETTLLTYTVVSSFHISQLIGWGTVDAEFLIYKNNTMVGGGWSSPSQRTLNITYEVAPISANADDVIKVTVSQFYGSSQVFRVNLLGE